MNGCLLKSVLLLGCCQDGWVGGGLLGWGVVIAKRGCRWFSDMCCLQRDEETIKPTDSDGESLAMLQLSAGLKLRELVSRLDVLADSDLPYDC